jgi:hypothetical protein
MSNAVDRARGRKPRDRATLPCIALLVSSFLSAMGYSSGSAMLMWILPACLVGASLLYVFLPRRGEHGESAH